MYKPLALAIAAGLLFAVGCKKETEEQKALAQIPTVAPEVAKTPDAVLGHIQYAMVRQDPKHLEIFIPENKSLANGGTQWFHDHAGELRLLLTAEEIETLGVQDLLKKGYISDKFTRGEVKAIFDELDSGKRKESDIPTGLGSVNQTRLDMPMVSGLDKKTAEMLQKDLLETLETNPKAIFAAGLYRVFKAIPVEAWPYIAATAHPNAVDKTRHDLVLRVDDRVQVEGLKDEDRKLATVVVGPNPDGTMYISYVQFHKYPRFISRVFSFTQESSEQPSEQKT
jgi:hypothetical protein